MLIYWYRFLVENSKDVFGRSEFDQNEVPEILHSSLQRLLIGRYFKFLLQQTSHSPNQQNCAVVSRIIPLQTQLDIDLLTLLKCSYLGHELTKNENSVNFSTCHTPFSDRRELLYNCERTRDCSIVEIRSFTADDSDLCAAAQTTQQTNEDTSLALELLCDFFTPPPSVCDNNLTSQQPSSSSLVLNTKLTSNPPDEIDSQEKLDFDLPSDLDLQLEIVRQLEADWLLSQTQPSASFSATCTEQETRVSSSLDPASTFADEHRDIHTFPTDNLEHMTAITDWESTQPPRYVPHSSVTDIVQQSIVDIDNVTSKLFSPSSMEHINHSSRLESPELFSAHPTPSTDQLTPIFSSQDGQQQHQASLQSSPNHCFTDCRSTLRPLQLNYSSVQQGHLVTSSTPMNPKRCRSAFIRSPLQERSEIKRKKYRHSTSKTQTPSTAHCDSANSNFGFSPDIL